MKTGTSLGLKSSAKALLVGLCLLVCEPGFSATPDEYTLKLVYLYNFTKFINWPDSGVADQEKPFHICIIGNMPAADALKQLEYKRSKNRPITTSRQAIDKETGDCHILFITKSISKSDVKKILSLPLRNTITVGETRDFAKHAGDIGFVIDENNHIRIEINLLKTHSKNVNIRAPLLEIARKVYRDEEQG